MTRMVFTFRKEWRGRQVALDDRLAFPRDTSIDVSRRPTLRQVDCRVLSSVFDIERSEVRFKVMLVRQGVLDVGDTTECCNDLFTHFVLRHVNGD